ncbi:MAG: butyrate kinase [Holophagaceae bacterium]|uniref:Probable butyrate kinase n=1 Tax=Candidatus Geothrix skivensis TaxID=2954439 RepID=A0A9D7XHK3_9BACT|nr:butyrate kinase [Candidatus Geothrix skivensis]
MFDIEASLDSRLLAESRNRPTVVFPEALDGRTLEAACYLGRFIRPVFLAPEAAVRALAERELSHLGADRVAFTLSEAAFLDPASRPDLLETFAEACLDWCRLQERPMCIEAARKLVAEAGHFGIWAVKLGHADMVVGGAIHEPKAFFRPMVEILAQRPVTCETGVFVLPDEHPQEVYPHNIVVFGDVGVNASMSPRTLAEVAVGTCAVARDLIPEEVLPEIRCAMVSYSNRGSDEGPSPELVRRAADLVPEILAERVRHAARYASIHIRGEVKVSVALSRRSADLYHAEGLPWEGGPNVIVCPNLDMGNLLYNLYATRFPGARKFPVMFGLRFQGVDLPMDCTPEDIRLAVKASVMRLHHYGEWRRTPKDTFFRRHRVLVLNPGSTSTKTSVFEGDEERCTEEIQHPAEAMKGFEGRPITEQFSFRKDAVLRFLADQGMSLKDLDAVAGRGGLLRPIPHGTWNVGPAMLEDLRAGGRGEHASNLGALIAAELVAGTSKPAFIVDPVVVDEVEPKVKITGLKELPRRVVSHALNQIATARRYAEEHETFYERINVIVAHMGGGITVGAHRKGRYLDVNNGLDGEGPFSPQRSGSLPPGQLIELCFSGKYTKAELKLLNKGRGGLIDLLGTADMREVERRVEQGDAEAALVYEALTYQIAKAITALLPAFEGEAIDAILLTGGMARSRRLVGELGRLTSALGCEVQVYPGENEMAALAKGALRVLSGREQAKTYPPV